MKTAIYATLYHRISTDKKPQHFKCPFGQESWCFYQAAIASGIKPGSHKELVKTPVNEAHLAKILPIYQRLASNELLERCIRCMTQNSNETLHSVIWSKCSKISSASMKRVNIAACEAISEFNIGTLKTLELLQNENNMQLNTSARNLALYKDYRRSIKYVCKYVNKGSDTAVFELTNGENDQNEIHQHQMGRYISSNEAVWRIFNFPIHKRSSTVIPLSVQLENGQSLYFTTETAA
ncbi:hypothetical protein AVEN_45668-1 [Araneus ventricosus]|uniref:Uncharacterized protein n=1 Tax=Araneus ventricosus TaxID=182803 RepID=A0A4Y2SVA9_ARAVE|nr:hypothetical protein AVEN_45668-1 [Araneus ventricosus]